MIHGWFTVVAQIINFVILVWLLKRFLYKPILDAIDAREKNIADQLTLAEIKVADAQKQREEFQRKTLEIDQQRDALLSTARDDAKAERQHLLDEARKEAEGLREKRRESLRNEQQNLNGAIVRWTQREVFSITRKTLKDLANSNLEQQMVDVFATKLRNLDDKSRAMLAAALQSPSHNLHIRSAFDLTPDQRTSIDTALKSITPANTSIQITIVPDLVTGIELSSGGQRVAWSVADYLATLEQHAADLLSSEVNSGTSTT
jgi:F-type H+-transporting ATPase subunit b